MDVEKLKKEILECKKCGLHKTRKRAVPGDLNTKAKVMFIGIAPGRLGADRTGIPFTKDKSGKFLREMIEKSGLSLEEVTVTNVVRCNPKDESGSNRYPTMEEILTCAEYLKREIEIINPKVLVPLGKIPTEYLLKEKVQKMGEFNGKVFERDKKVVYPLFHPSYLVNYPGYDKEKYRKDFEKIYTLI